MSDCPYTVLIVTWNGDGLLRDCLESIRAALPQCPPCVVVDNANLESTKELCAGFGFVTYVPSKENLGFAGGNNLGLPFCKTKYVCLLNNDTIIHTDSFTPLVAFLECHPGAAVAQGTMKLPRCNNTLDDCGTTLKWYGVQHHRYFRKPDPGDLAPTKVFAAKGAFMMIRRSVVETLGGVLFHGHFKSYYEETDFCHRVWLSGSEVWFVPTPPIDHLLGSTSAKFDNASIWRQYIANIFIRRRLRRVYVSQPSEREVVAFPCAAVRSRGESLTPQGTWKNEKSGEKYSPDYRSRSSETGDVTISFFVACHERSLVV